ncbi:MAG: hypothetical protein EBT66_02115 [Bacteroidetes bacterium]|nr:hypothetical protein [Bacteroidota bacterium]
MGKLKRVLCCISVFLAGSTSIQAQSYAGDMITFSNPIKRLQVLSPSAQLFTNPVLRSSLVPTFDGKYDAQLLVSSDFILPSQVELLSEINDLEILGNRIIHVRFDEGDWTSLINQEGLAYIDLSAKINSPRTN